MSRVLTILAAAASVSIAAGLPLAPEDEAWFWYSECGGPSMIVEVRIDAQTAYKSTVPICHRRRAAAESMDGRMEIAWHSDRVISWDEERPASPAGASLELDVWQAGADPDAMLLGVSVVSGDAIHLNTIHIAHPDRRDESRLAPGIVVRTYPARH